MRLDSLLLRDPAKFDPATHQCLPMIEPGSRSSAWLSVFDRIRPKTVILGDAPSHVWETYDWERARRLARILREGDRSVVLEDRLGTVVEPFFFRASSSARRTPLLLQSLTLRLRPPSLPPHPAVTPSSFACSVDEESLDADALALAGPTVST